MREELRMLEISSALVAPEQRHAMVKACRRGIVTEWSCLRCNVDETAAGARFESSEM